MNKEVRRKGILPDQRGNALVVTVLITMALSGLVLGALMSSQVETRLSNTNAMEQKAFYLTERGVEESIATLAQMSAPLIGGGDDGTEPVNLFFNKETSVGTFSAWADPLDSSTGQRTRFVAITVRGVLDGIGVSKAIQVKLGQQNFSRFAYFTDIETMVGGGTIWFTGNDEFFGPVHTNDQARISGDPIFHEEFTSAEDHFIYYHGGPPNDNPVFEEGYQLGAPEIPLPSNLDKLKIMAQEPGGLYLTGSVVEIEMRVDSWVGRLKVRINDSGAIYYDIPQNGVLYVNGDVEVFGELMGRLTIASAKNIEIMDDCTYHTDPRVDPSSTDMLGLVAEQNVFMDGDPHGDNVDIGDETVMAAIMALDETFMVENWWSGSARGNLVLYGGLIQKRRGPVGTFNPWTQQVVSGYAKAYSYDPRFMDMPPPFFPTTGEVDKVSWREIDPSTDITANFW